jgi:hypothetical protein
MSQNQVTAAVSVSTVCEPVLIDAKNCSELGIQILAPLRDSSARRLGFVITIWFVLNSLLNFVAVYSPEF